MTLQERRKAVEEAISDICFAYGYKQIETKFTETAIKINIFAGSSMKHNGGFADEIKNRITTDKKIYLYRICEGAILWKEII